MTTAVSLVMVVSCGGSEDEHSPIDVDSLPEGDATGTAAAGNYEYAETVTSSECPDSVSGILLPAGTSSTLVTFTQEEGHLAMHVAGDEDRPRYFLDGGIYESRRFEIGGTYYFHESMGVIFVRYMKGRFNEAMNQFDGTGTVRVRGSDGTDCEFRFSFEGTRF